MSAYETMVLERLGQALPQMTEMKKAWLLGLVEGLAGEPSRMNNQAVPSDQERTARPGA